MAKTEKTSYEKLHDLFVEKKTPVKPPTGRNSKEENDFVERTTAFVERIKP